MRTLALLALSLALAFPSASAGYLVNVEIGGPTLAFGGNVFGGSGDTVDVGVANAQCSDEADVVDVGVANQEGMGGRECGYRCEHTRGEDPVAAESTILHPEADETPARCGDGSDTVDVGLLNREGSRGEEPVCDEMGCQEPQPVGDERDAVDAGLLNDELGDDDDGADAGVLNCESSDRRDAVDVGLLNAEWDDRGDTFDLSLLNTEWPEGGDANGLKVGGARVLPIEAACGLVVRVDPGLVLPRLL